MENKIMHLSIAEIFSPWAGGRFPSDGSENGETFREQHFIPALKNDEVAKVIVSFKGLFGLGSSFKEELFGGTIRKNIPLELLEKKLEIESNSSSDQAEIWKYINDAYLNLKK